MIDNRNRLTAYFIIISIIILITSVNINAQWMPYTGFDFYGNPYGYWNQPYTWASDSGFSTPYGNYPSPISYLSPGLLSLELEHYNNYSYNDIFSPYSSFMSSGSFFGPAFSSFNSSGAASPVYPEPVPVGQNSSALYMGSIGYNPYYPLTSSSAFIPNTPNPYTMSLAWYSPWLVPPSSLPPSIIRFPNYDDPNAKPISPSPWE